MDCTGERTREGEKVKLRRSSLKRNNPCMKVPLNASKGHGQAPMMNWKWIFLLPEVVRYYSRKKAQEHDKQCENGVKSAEKKMMGYLFTCLSVCQSVCSPVCL